MKSEEETDLVNDWCFTKARDEEFYLKWNSINLVNFNKKRGMIGLAKKIQKNQKYLLDKFLLVEKKSFLNWSRVTLDQFLSTQLEKFP